MPFIYHQRVALLYLFSIAFLLLIAACGEPPTKTESTQPQTESPANAPVTNVRDLATTDTAAVSESAKADRSVLPANAPKDAEIITNITPGKHGGKIVVSTVSIGGEPSEMTCR